MMLGEWFVVLIVVSLVSQGVNAYPAGYGVENTSQDGELIYRQNEVSNDNPCKKIINYNETLMSYSPTFEGRLDWLGYLASIPLLVLTVVVYYIKRRIDRVLREFIPTDDNLTRVV